MNSNQTHFAYQNEVPKTTPYQKNFLEGEGLVLRKIACTVWFLLPFFVWLIALPIFMFFLGVDPTVTPLTVDDECYIEYYELIDSTWCEVYVTFEEEVDPGDISVAFYDENGYLLEKRVAPFAIDTAESNTLYSVFYVNGYVDSYEIVDTSDIQPASYGNYLGFYAFLWIWAGIRLIYVIPGIILTLCLSCKTYQYNNDSILVYAGYFKYYLKVNGVVYDQKFALMSFIPIQLECTTPSGNQIEVFIPSFTKRFSMKVNGAVYR